MASGSTSRSRVEGSSRIAFVGVRAMPALLTIAIFAAASKSTATAFDGESVARSGVASAGSQAAGGGGDQLELWDNGYGQSDVCARRRDLAEVCFACPDLVAPLGITDKQCCNDAIARRMCVEAVTSALVEKAMAASGIDNGDDEQDGTDVEKRAKYFLGKRAKYFLGKRAFGVRRLGGYRGSAAGDSSPSARLAYPSSAEKRVKYFLG